MTAPLLEKMKFYIVVPQAATNLVINPTPYRATTGYTAVTGTIAASDVYTRRGPGCIEVTPTTAESGVYFGTVSVTNTENYVFSCDVKGEDGKAMRLRVEDAGGTYTYEETFNATGYWQRKEVTFTAEETASDYRLYVLRDATTGTTVFHVDGFQFEEGTKATTFFSGDTKGFGKAPLEFYWGGTPHASVSYRTADTRAGGALLDIEDYAYEIIATAGLGMGNYAQIYNELASGGAYYQKHIRKPRNFSLILHYHGNNPGDLHDARNTILEAVRPDYTGYEQPLIIRYQGEDISGDEATNPVDIVCIPQFSHQDLPFEPINNRDVLNFTVLASYLQGAYKEGKELDLNIELTDANYFIMRDKTGVWSIPNNAGSGIANSVFDLEEANNGDVIIGAYGVNHGGVAEADYLCKWTGSAIESVTGSADFNSYVFALDIDASGNIYICGEFTGAGDANGNRIVKWDGTNLSSLGTGLSGASVRIRSMAIEPNTGYVYVAGDFTEIGGVAGTANIAYWDGTAWNALATGLNDTVEQIKFSPDGKLYAVGSFTNADGVNGDFLCYWDGSAFHMVGDTELIGNPCTLAFDSFGRLYIGAISYTNIGGNPNADFIARWNGSSWENLGTGMNQSVTNIEVFDDVVYAMGFFTEAGGVPVYDVAKWENGAWKPLSIGLGSGSVNKVLKTKSGDFYIGYSGSGTVYGASQATVTNTGNTNVYPTIEVTGAGILQTIENVTTGKSITFNDLNLQEGETVTLKLDPIDIQMTSTWAGRGNLLKYINPGSDLGQFYLRPGDNYIAFFMPSGTTTETKAYIYWTPKFWNLEGSRYE